MRILKRCVLMAWIAVLALPLCAYQLALKDGRIIKFAKYRATETAVLYVDAQGKEIAVPLSSVDLERTQQLNAQEPVPLKLPGMVSSASVISDQVSLGDIAHKVEGKKKTTAKHVYTNDDFQEVVAEDSGQDTTSGKNISPADTHIKSQELIEKYIKENDRLFADLKTKTTGQLVNEITNGVTFPGHERWEEELSSAKDRLVTVGTESNRLLESLYVRGMNGDRTQETGDLFVQQSQQLKLERGRYDEVVSRGRSAAIEWKKELLKRGP